MIKDIRERTRVACSDSEQFAAGRVHGHAVRRTKHRRGDHHWIPKHLVTYVNEKVPLDRPGDRAMREWMTPQPKTA